MTTTTDSAVLNAIQSFRQEMNEALSTMRREFQDALKDTVKRDESAAVNRAVESRLATAEGKVTALDATLSTAQRQADGDHAHLRDEIRRQEGHLDTLSASVKRLEDAPAQRTASLRVWIAGAGVIVTLLSCASGAFFATISVAANVIFHLIK